MLSPAQTKSLRKLITQARRSAEKFADIGPMGNYPEKYAAKMEFDIAEKRLQTALDRLTEEK